MAKSTIRTRKFIWLIFFVIILLASSLFKPVQNAWSGLGRGVQNWWWNGGYYFNNWFHTASLVKERDQLLAQKNQWLSDQAKIINLEQKTTKLEVALKFLEQKKFNYVGVRIIAKDPINERLLTIDRGKSDGLKIGQIMIDEQGVVLGKIVEVGTKQASILLINDAKSQLAVAMEGQKLIGLVEGRLGGGLIVNYIPLDLEIKPSQLIYTSGLEPAIPSGLVVGTISSVIKQTGDLFQIANVQSLVNLRAISRGWIIN